MHRRAFLTAVAAAAATSVFAGGAALAGPATETGLRAVGVAPEAAPKRAPRTKATDAPRKMREGSKQARLIEMLKRKEGASIEEIVEAFGWQPHTVRGAIAGALKKKLGLTVTSEKVDGRRVYRIEA